MWFFYKIQILQGWPVTIVVWEMMLNKKQSEFDQQRLNVKHCWSKLPSSRIDRTVATQGLRHLPILVLWIWIGAVGTFYVEIAFAKHTLNYVFPYSPNLPFRLPRILRCPEKDQIRVSRLEVCQNRCRRPCKKAGKLKILSSQGRYVKMDGNSVSVRLHANRSYMLFQQSMLGSIGTVV